MSRMFSRDFLLEVRKGNIPGHVSTLKTYECPVVGTSFSTLWDIATPYVWPTAGEAFEIVSTSANDAAAGTGARTVLITGLDDSYNVQTETVTMNGTSTVATTNTNWIHTDSILVTSAGSQQLNDGTITLRVSGGGNVRATMLPNRSRSFSGIYTVPAGKTMFILGFESFTSKGEDVTLQPSIRPFTTGIILSGIQAPTYQSQSGITYKTFPRLEEKTGNEWTAKTSAGTRISSLIFEIMEIENQFLDNA